MARQRPDGEYSREQHRGRQHHEHRVGKPVQIAERDASPRQLLAKVFVEVVREVDDVDEDRKSERRRDEDLPEFDEYVAVERPHHSLQAPILSRRTRRFFHPIFDRIDPLIAPIISLMSPPLAVVPSRPILASIQRATSAKRTFAIHIDTTAGMSPRLAIDSPAI